MSNTDNFDFSALNDNNEVTNSASDEPVVIPEVVTPPTVKSAAQAIQTDTSVSNTEVVEAGNKPVAIPSFNFDFSSLGNKVVVGKVGTKISRYIVDRVKFSKSSKAMISIITDDVVAVKTHFIDGVGSILCFGGDCCHYDSPKVRYIFPVVVYDTNSKGVPVTPEIRNCALALGSEAYEAICDIMNVTDGGISSIDLLVTCTDENYQKCNFTPAGKARWKQSSKISKEVNEFWSENSSHLLDAIAKNITPEEFAKKMEAENFSDTAQAEGVDFSKAFGI